MLSGARATEFFRFQHPGEAEHAAYCDVISEDGESTGHINAFDISVSREV